MVVECLAVVLVILVFVVMAYRRGAHRTAMMALPLVCLPLVHVVLTPFSAEIAAWIPGVGAELFAIAIDLLGLVVACVLLGMNSIHISLPKARRMYMMLCGGFSFLFCLLLIQGILRPLLA